MPVYIAAFIIFLFGVDTINTKTGDCKSKSAQVNNAINKSEDGFALVEFFSSCPRVDELVSKQYKPGLQA